MGGALPGATGNFLAYFLLVALVALSPGNRRVDSEQPNACRIRINGAILIAAVAILVVLPLVWWRAAARRASSRGSVRGERLHKSVVAYTKRIARNARSREETDSEMSGGVSTARLAGPSICSLCSAATSSILPIEPQLPTLFRHRMFQVDLGLALDFLICVFLYVPSSAISAQLAGNQRV